MIKDPIRCPYRKEILGYVYTHTKNNIPKMFMKELTFDCPKCNETHRHIWEYN